MMNALVGTVIGLFFILVGGIVWDDYLEGGAAFKGPLLLGIGCMFVIGGLLLSVKITKMPYQEPKLIATEHIVALSNDKDMQGRYYMRHGYIEEQPFYYYMVSTNGGYVMNKIPAMYDTTIIYYTDGDFRVEWCEQERQLLLDRTTKKTYKVYIPNNSIDETFSISLQ